VQCQPRAFFWKCNPDGAFRAFDFGYATVTVPPHVKRYSLNTIRWSTSSKNNRLSKSKSQNLCLTTSKGTDYRFAC
jgi:hypothetical protein